MGNEKRVSCPYHQSKYNAFHDICPLNGESECVGYKVIEKHLDEVDQAYGEYQRGAYVRPKSQKRISCPYNVSEKDAFHDICPLNGSVECERYQLLERRMKEVDKAYGEYQRGAYVRLKSEQSISDPDRVGGWKLAKMEPCALPQKVATGFAEIQIYGAHYIPVLYCGEQLVHGTNHMLICKQTLVVEHSLEHLVKVILHEPLPTEREQNWQIISIDEIV